MIPFEPDWTVPPAPKGDDESEVEAFCFASTGIPWSELYEWQREAWRREYRDTDVVVEGRTTWLRLRAGELSVVLQSLREYAETDEGPRLAERLTELIRQKGGEI